MPPYTKQDIKGRQIIAFHEVRSARVTAYATVTTGSPTILDPGDTDYFTDIVEIQLSNNSTVAVGVDLTNDGTKIRHFEIPANSTIEVSYLTALTQNTKNTPWLVDMADVTGTTVEVGAILTKEPQ